MKRVHIEPGENQMGAKRRIARSRGTCCMWGGMNRRGFLGLLTTAAAGIAIAPELAELLKPRPTIFLPPKGGWINAKWLVHENEFWVFTETTTEIWTCDQWKGSEIQFALAEARPMYRFNRIEAGV